MDIVWFLLIGLCAGWLASQLTKKGPFGLLGNLIVGIIGALLGGFLLGIVGLKGYTLLGQLVIATIGAVVLLLILGAINRTAGNRT